MLYVLGGLGLDYDALVTSLTNRTEPTDLDELHGFLTMNCALRIPMLNRLSFPNQWPTLLNVAMAVVLTMVLGMAEATSKDHSPTLHHPGLAEPNQTIQAPHGHHLHQTELLDKFVAVKITQP